MAIMAKKSKNVKAALEVTSDGASIDENVSIESESAKKKKKKKSKAGKEKSDLSVDTPTECTDIEEIDKSSKKDKKKKREKVENQIETMDLMSTVSDKMDTLNDKNNAQSSNSVSNSNGEDAPKRGGKSLARSSKQRLQADHEYVMSLLGAMHIPNHQKNEEEEFEEDDDGIETKEEKEKRIKPGGTSRAASSQELRDRLQAKLEELRGGKLGSFESKRQKKIKRKIAAIEKQKIADQEMKQKLMTIGKNAGNLNKVINKEVESLGVKMSKPSVKTEKGVVFSKFDFKDDMIPKEPKKNLDPKLALTKIKKNQEKIKLWEEKGKHEKAKAIENNIAWDNALGKAQGEKVKDDEYLLKKSIQKQQQIKKSSKKKWDARADGVKAKGSAAADKREENLNKRKQDKKAKKMKRLAAKGRNVPGS